jgi:hypothetical protein
LEIKGKWKCLIIDTGSNVSILQPGVSRHDVRATAVRPYGVTGEALDIRGQQLVSFVLGGRKFSHTFLVCPLPTESDGLFSTDFLEKTGADINFDIGQLSLDGMNKPQYGCDNVANKPAALTVFPRDTPESEKPLQSLKEEPKRKRPGLDSQASDKTTRYSKSRLVKMAQDVTIAPRCRHVVAAKLDLEKGREIPSLVEHRAGTKIPQADALSRHVGTLSGEVRLSPEEVTDKGKISSA